MLKQGEWESVVVPGEFRILAKKLKSMVSLEVTSYGFSDAFRSSGGIRLGMSSTGRSFWCSRMRLLAMGDVGEMRVGARTWSLIEEAIHEYVMGR